MEPIYDLIFRPSHAGNVFDDKRRLNLYALEHWNGKLRLLLDLTEKLCHFSTDDANSTKQSDLNDSSGNQIQERIRKKSEILKAISILRARQKKERGARHSDADKLAVRKRTGKALKTHLLRQRPTAGESE